MGIIVRTAMTIFGSAQVEAAVQPSLVQAFSVFAEPQNSQGTPRKSSLW